MAELMVERPQIIEANSFEWPKVPQSKIESKEVPNEPQQPLETLTERKPEPQPLPGEADNPTERIKALEQLDKAQTQSSRNNPPTASRKTAEVTKAEILERRNTKFPLFGLKKTQWPEPHLSLGTPCSRLGNNECWKAIGPAQDLFDLISKSIGDLLDTRVEDLEEGEPVAGHILLFDMYMVGKSATTAQPTLLFTCQRPKPRRRAIKYIRESGILKGHPKILLAESSLPPLASGTSYLRLLSGTNLNSFRMASSTMSRRDVPPTPVPTHAAKVSYLWIIGAVLGPVIAFITLALVVVFTRRKHSRKRARSYDLPPRRTHGMDEKKNIEAPTSKNFFTRHMGAILDMERSVKANESGVMERQEVRNRRESIFQNPPRFSFTELPGIPPMGSELYAVGGVLNSKSTKTQASAPSSTAPEMAQVKLCEPAESTFYGRYQGSDGSFGIPILCSGTRKRATIGEVVHVNGKYYGLTAAHPFAALSTWSTDDKAPTRCQEIDPEFSFVSEDEEEGEGDMSEVAVTSQASMSSADSEAGLSRSNTTASTFSRTEGENTVSTAAIDNYVIRFEKEGLNIHSGRKSSIIGRLSASSLSGIDPGLDWALIELSDQSFYDTRYLNGLRNLWIGTGVPRQVLSGADIGEHRRVVVVFTGYSGTIRGFLLPGSTAMKLTPRSKFQEVWTVQLEENIGSGDSGSYVVDAINRDLCGQIVAGAPGERLAYIIPASNAFAEMEKILGGRVDILDHYSGNSDSATSPALPEKAQLHADPAPSAEVEIYEVHELPAVEPVGSELSTPMKARMKDDQPVSPMGTMPLSPLPLLFAMTEMRDQRNGVGDVSLRHDTFYHP